MKQLKKTLLTLVALLAVTTGAWADDTYTIKFEANGNSKTVENVTLPHTFSCDYSGENGELDQIIKQLYGLSGGCCSQLSPGASGNSNVTAGMNGDNQFITISAPFEGNATVTGSYFDAAYSDFGYSLTISCPGYAPASSALEVAWTAASKTGTFTMPGGNVTLQPEYYPQAALAAAPTAINNVPATTDGAIVEAGTVKNIGSTTTAQGTVMYYVSPTALDDAALLALAADQWTADVPTAESLAQGQAYVYYYVRGNDSDTDDENFSDGDILAANALTVTIAAAPTYAVTFADGVNPEPPAEPEWTASPATGVTKGETVTVTYTGTKKVIGVKAEKKAAEKTITVTWNNDDITGSGTSFTKDGVTITAGDMDFKDKNFMFDGTFTTTLGNFTKIEVTTGYWDASGTGWSGSGQSGTWTGTPASGVSFSGSIVGAGLGNTKFVFTIEPTN